MELQQVLQSTAFTHQYLGMKKRKFLRNFSSFSMKDLVLLLILTVQDCTCLAVNKSRLMQYPQLERLLEYHTECCLSTMLHLGSGNYPPNGSTEPLWGWKQQGCTWQIVWTSLQPVSESRQQLTKCGCRTARRGRCKCYRFSLPCTEL